MQVITMTEKKNKIFGPLILVAAAMIWGLSFVAQKSGMDYVEGFTFTAIRLVLATVTLLPLVLINRKKNPDTLGAEEKKIKNRHTVKGIVCVGLCLFVGLNLQQFAFNYIEAGKVGFITALYMLLVPIFGLFLKKKPPFTVWIGVTLGVIALYFICMSGESGLKLGKGEILTLICAVAFSIHILVIDHFSDIDSIELSCGQFFVAGILSLILMFIFEKPDVQGLKGAAIPIIYSGVFSSAVAFTFQIAGQKKTEPALASMLLCLESVFSVIFAFILPPHERMTVLEYVGCGIMFIGILIAQITPKKKL